MHSILSAARLAGLLYVLMSILTALGLIEVPSVLIVRA